MKSSEALSAKRARELESAKMRECGWLTTPNLLSISRIPLALVFISGGTAARSAAVVVAALTDFLDGYWARRFRAGSWLGRLIDPLVDKFFVFCCMATLLQEHTMNSFQIAAFLTRDLALALFLFYAFLSGIWRRCQLRSIWWGRAFTTLQFGTLLVFTLFGTISNLIVWPLFALGPPFFLELMAGERGELRSR